MVVSRRVGRADRWSGELRRVGSEGGCGRCFCVRICVGGREDAASLLTVYVSRMCARCVFHVVLSCHHFCIASLWCSCLAIISAVGRGRLNIPVDTCPRNVNATNKNGALLCIARSARQRRRQDSDGMDEKRGEVTRLLGHSGEQHVPNHQQQSNPPEHSRLPDVGELEIVPCCSKLTVLA